MLTYQLPMFSYRNFNLKVKNSPFLCKQKHNNNKTITNICLYKKWHVFDFEIEITVTKHG